MAGSAAWGPCPLQPRLWGPLQQDGPRPRLTLPPPDDPGHAPLYPDSLRSLPAWKQTFSQGRSPSLKIQDKVKVSQSSSGSCCQPSPDSSQSQILETYSTGSGWIWSPSLSPPSSPGSCACPHAAPSCPLPLLPAYGAVCPNVPSLSPSPHSHSSPHGCAWAVGVARGVVS